MANNALQNTFFIVLSKIRLISKTNKKGFTKLAMASATKIRQIKTITKQKEKKKH